MQGLWKALDEDGSGGLQPHVPRAASPCATGCNPMCPGLHHVPQAATPCAPGCNPVCPGLQPRVPRTATLFATGCELRPCLPRAATLMPGFIGAGEFGRFMRAGDTDTQAKRTAVARKQLQQRLALQKQEMQANYDKLVGRDINQKLRRVASLSYCPLPTTP